MFSQRDKEITRELAKKYTEQVTSPKYERMKKRIRDNNDLISGRPPVLIDEIPWHQMNIGGELTLACEDSVARSVEEYFRRALFYFKYFPAEHNYEPFFRIKRAVSSTGIGVEIDSEERRFDNPDEIVSREFRDVLEDESALSLLHDPVFTLHPEIDEENMEKHTELLGDAIPIKLYGTGTFTFAPWDDIAFLRGVEPILLDMYDRPQYLHAIMDRFVSAANAQIDFIEKNLDVDPTHPNLHCTPGTVSGLAQSGLGAAWFRGTAQALGVVSPEMFREFEISHIKPVAERFAYTYYGCCEPMDDRISVVKDIKNLRKIGCSPWARVDACAEQIGKSFVLARKPNPSNVARLTEPEVIKRELEETVKACIKYGCPYEYVLKDISTVSGRPENLILWANTVNQVLNKYYDEI